MPPKPPPPQGQKPTVAPPLKMEEWNEEQLEKALNQLNEIHAQLRVLRTTIPRMLEPIPNAAGYPSPSAFMAAFKDTVNTAQGEISKFKETMTSQESQALLAHAAQSRRKNPLGIRPWSPQDDLDGGDARDVEMRDASSAS